MRELHASKLPEYVEKVRVGDWSTVRIAAATARGTRPTEASGCGAAGGLPDRLTRLDAPEGLQ